MHLHRIRRSFSVSSSLFPRMAKACFTHHQIQQKETVQTCVSRTIPTKKTIWKEDLTFSTHWWNKSSKGTRISWAISSSCGGTGSFATFGFKKYCKRHNHVRGNKHSGLLKYHAREEKVIIDSLMLAYLVKWKDMMRKEQPRTVNTLATRVWQTPMQTFTYSVYEIYDTPSVPIW